MAFTTTATIASFGGKILKLTHVASTTSCTMAVNLFLPPLAAANPSAKIPVLFWLSGLTCTPDNCIEKGFLQHKAAERGIAVVYPDTSPRGLKIAGEDDSWDFGTGAGFYVDATQEPWSKGYKMYSYITSELPKALFGEYRQLDSQRISISGHSMGGHGALMVFLKNPGMFKSASAFAPIANPINAPWGQKAFKGYLGENEDSWKQWDASELIKSYQGELNILIDVGKADSFYQQKQLLPENLAAAAKEAGHGGQVKVRYHDGYDHSYFMIASFADDHVEHAAKHLFASG